MIGTPSQRRFALKSLVRAANRYECICESLRQVYDSIMNLPQKDKITEHLIDGMIFAKKMSDRLEYYQKTYNDKTGHGGSNLNYIYGAAKTSRLRARRKI